MRRSEQGQILVLTLLVVVLLTAALLIIAATLQSRLKLVRRETDVIRLTALADAALAETLAHLAVSPAYSGVPQRELGDGVITSRVEAAGANRRTVHARAEYRGRRRDVQALVQITALGPVVLDWRVVASRSAAEPASAGLPP